MILPESRLRRLFRWRNMGPRNGEASRPRLGPRPFNATPATRPMGPDLGPPQPRSSRRRPGPRQEGAARALIRHVRLGRRQGRLTREFAEMRGATALSLRISASPWFHSSGDGGARRCHASALRRPSPAWVPACTGMSGGGGGPRSGPTEGARLDGLHHLSRAMVVSWMRPFPRWTWRRNGRIIPASRRWRMVISRSWSSSTQIRG